MKRKRYEVNQRVDEVVLVYGELEWNRSLKILQSMLQSVSIHQHFFRQTRGSDDGGSGIDTNSLCSIGML